MTVIDSFQGEYRFLSNFYPSPIDFVAVTYPTVEHAYQAFKTRDLEQRVLISRLPTPGQAKRAGRLLEIRSDWESIKLEVMADLVELKFLTHKDLLERLVVTYPAELIEGNTWGDRFWGQVDGIGENHLGRILMTVRRDLAGLLRPDQNLPVASERPQLDAYATEPISPDNSSSVSEKNA